MMAPGGGLSALSGDWPAWWLGAILLSVVPVVHWLLLGQMLAVSGRVTRLVDAGRRALARVWQGRSRGTDGPAPDMTDAELLAALVVATRAEFGPAADVPKAAEPAVPLASTASRAEARVGEDLTFFAGLLLGGALARLGRGPLAPGFHLDGTMLSRLCPSRGGQALLLLVGGVLVGFGVRMAGGCTSGHGLCGVTRGQRGSLVSTAAFLGAAVGTAYAMEALLCR